MAKRKSNKLSKTTITIILLFSVGCWLVEQFGLLKEETIQETQTEQVAENSRSTQSEDAPETGKSNVPATEKSDVSSTGKSDARAAKKSVAGKSEVEKLEIPVLEEQRPEQIIEHSGYTVSFNPEWNIPNWVAYELSVDETDGVEERSNHFVPDPDVKGDPVVTKDYSNSGYDRGHMAPAADMKWSEQAMRESFYMTNMCPQNHNLNAGDWKVLEEQVRNWATEYDHVWICCGPIVSDASHTIGEFRHIVVPQSFFKVVLRQKGDSWAGIGFMMANRPRDGKWTLGHYAMTIEDMEIVTGINFFPNIPDEVEEIVEKTYTLSDWGIR